MDAWPVGSGACSSVQVSIAVTVLTLSFVLLSPLGINGPGVAYVSGQGIVALILLPSVVRQYRRPDMSPGFAPGAPLVTRSSGMYDSMDRTVATAAPEERADAVTPQTRSDDSGVPSVWRRRDPASDAASTSPDVVRDEHGPAKSTRPSTTPRTDLPHPTRILHVAGRVARPRCRCVRDVVAA